ncbi:autotransporter outer membrane beta-barrel domain-containing protein [Bradyrhizobium ivorense]|uniref:autotransporter outer membrane beta-barrel domain-containing protein n=1 Tax=Bradyrhizobium ivorense TaxID=2511166 RepID=UPI003D31B985
MIFPGFFDTARARYDATTAQVFGEIGYGLSLGRVALEPFAGLAWARLDTGRFGETAAAAPRRWSASATTRMSATPRSAAASPPALPCSTTCS